MAKAQYIGVAGVARKVPKEYIGVAGVARKVKKGYIGVAGVARQYFSGGTPISSVAVGGTVKVAENGTPVDYIVVQIGTPNSTAYANCDGYWLLRKNVSVDTGPFGKDNDGDPDGQYNYNWPTVTNSFVTNYIRPREVVFYNSYSARLRSLIFNPTLPVYWNFDRDFSIVTSPAHVFHLGLYEIHYFNGTTSGGQTLTYFANAKIRREKDSPDVVAYDDNGQASNWWVRDCEGGSSYYTTMIGSNGGLYTARYSSAGYRPCFIVPKTIKLEDLL